MMAVPGTLPAPTEQDRWSFEMKWDGVRLVLYAEDGAGPAGFTRNDRDVLASYPELAALARDLSGHGVVLDGEVVALDRAGRPDFALLQQRMHLTRPVQVEAAAAAVPATYLVFDLLRLDGRSLVTVPHEDRRALLEDLSLAGPSWAVPPAFAGDGEAALAVSVAQGLEGVVAKRRDSRYEPGRRSPSWVKVKNIRTQEVVVGGFRPGQGNRAGTVGSLLLGIPGTSGLEYVGHVGTGFSGSVLADLWARLGPLTRTTSPFASDLPRADVRDAVWVEPRLVGEVAYGEFTPQGRMRHPTWRGLRVDKAPADVVREDVVGG